MKKNEMLLIGLDGLVIISTTALSAEATSRICINTMNKIDPSLDFHDLKKKNTRSMLFWGGVAAGSIIGSVIVRQKILNLEEESVDDANIYEEEEHFVDDTTTHEDVDITEDFKEEP
jgi:hypothetical protein